MIWIIIFSAVLFLALLGDNDMLTNELAKERVVGNVKCTMLQLVIAQQEYAHEACNGYWTGNLADTSLDSTFYRLSVDTVLHIIKAEAQYQAFNLGAPAIITVNQSGEFISTTFEELVQ